MEVEYFEWTALFHIMELGEINSNVYRCFLWLQQEWEWKYSTTEPYHQDEEGYEKWFVQRFIRIQQEVFDSCK